MKWIRCLTFEFNTDILKQGKSAQAGNDDLVRIGVSEVPTMKSIGIWIRVNSDVRMIIAYLTLFKPTRASRADLIHLSSSENIGFSCTAFPRSGRPL